MVLTDQFSRYPEVEFTRSIAITPVRERLKKIFATHGVPKVVQTDNGPPFRVLMLHFFFTFELRTKS